MHLGSAHVKASSKMLVKSTPGEGEKVMKPLIAELEKSMPTEVVAALKKGNLKPFVGQIKVCKAPIPTLI
jgi:hypothetical protein